jgi:hypothetical protein
LFGVDLVSHRGKRTLDPNNHRANVSESDRLRSHFQQHGGAANVAIQSCRDVAFDRQFQP